MDNTWVKLYRKIAEHEILFDEYGLRVFIWLLTRVDKKTGKCTISRFRTAELLKMNPNTFKDVINRMSKKYKIITTKSTNKHTEVSLLNWAKYNEFQEKTPGKTPTKHQQDTTPLYITRHKDIETEKRICQKSLTPCKDECMWEIGMKQDTHKRNVLQKSDDLQDYIEDHPRKYKNFHKTLNNWVKGDLAKGYISYMTETERMEMEYDDPVKVAQRKKLHELASKEGAI